MVGQGKLREGEGLHLSKVAAERLLLINIVDDFREEIAASLREFGYDVHAVGSLADALPKLAAEPMYSVAMIVAWEKGARLRGAYDELVDGIRAIRQVSADTQVVMTIDASVDVSVCCEAINNGLAGFVEIDESGRIDNDVLRKRLDHACQRHRRSVEHNKKLHSGEIYESTGIVGCSRAMASLLQQASRAAEISDAPVLTYGESGTGKQLLAEMIHRLDPKRSSRAFLAVNCAAITGTLAESALFGHVKGAFTGATEPRDGYFRAADGGTVFLDEIGEMSLELQPKLLRFLQEGVVMPVGSDREYAVDVRVIAASNRRIPALVEEERFRLDLYQRLNVIALEIPPLRERREDIPLLVDFFIKKYAMHYDKPVARVGHRVHQLLSGCALEGNVRELENLIRRAMAFKTEGDELTLRDLPSAFLERHVQSLKSTNEVLTRETLENACNMIAAGRMTLPEFVDRCERVVLEQSIENGGENQADLSRMLGLSTRTLYNKRRKYRL